MIFKFKLFILYLLAISTPALALDFREATESGELFATGNVEPGDAEKLARIVTPEYKQRYGLIRGLVTLSLDSSGGSLLGGLQLGYAIRQLGVHTNIGAKQSCMSSCALAFLGGQQRTVEGKFGVHAASFNPTAKQAKFNDQLDSIQEVSAIITAYVTQMTGKSDVALKALSTSAASISILDDSELVSMGVITIARRPSQFGRPGFKCLVLPLHSRTTGISYSKPVFL